jgi:hypothetical protein
LWNFKFSYFFQIHSSARRNNASLSVWCIVHTFDTNVLCRLLYRHGKVLSWIINICRYMSEIIFYFSNRKWWFSFVNFYEYPPNLKILQTSQKHIIPIGVNMLCWKADIGPEISFVPLFNYVSFITLFPQLFAACPVCKR